MQLGGLLLDLDPDTFGQPMGSEDCLYLNVWRPKSNDDGLPVFLYVHGGMNMVGESATSLYHGSNLAHEGNMIVVTINYRLGPMGWFAHPVLKTGDPLDDSGNYGLLDIIQALTWVQKNIETFGGDPGNVTLAGESAGGANVISLLASPAASGLFHRAVSMSPASTDKSVPIGDAHEVTSGVLLNLLINDGLANSESEAAELVEERGEAWVRDYLLSAEGEDLLHACTPFTALGINGLGLLVEPLLSTRVRDGIVIPEDYPLVFTEGRYNRVPTIIGSNAEEMRIFELAFGVITELNEAELCDLIQTYDPEDFEMSLSDFVPPYLQPLYAFIGNAVGTLLFEETGVRPLVEKARMHQDVYVYKFAWNDQPAPMDFLVGASHMMGLPFLFGNFHVDRSSLFRFAGSEENRPGREALSRAMIAYWARFAWTGNPNLGADADLPTWEPCSNEEPGPKHILLDTEISMGE
jgi:para-nitrobenzyl esterase